MGPESSEWEWPEGTVQRKGYSLANVAATLCKFGTVDSLIMEY